VAELRRQKLLLAEEELELRRAEANAEKMLIRAPIAGIVVPSRIRRGQEYGEVKTGDELRPGYPFVQVMDPDSLVLNAALNQVDASRVRPGMAARLAADAMPALILPGRVVSIGALAAATAPTGACIRTSAPAPISLSSRATDSRFRANASRGRVAGRGACASGAASVSGRWRWAWACGRRRRCWLAVASAWGMIWSVVSRARRGE
jgi:hypothetical protein